MEQESIIWLSILYQPVHSTQDVLHRRLTRGVLMTVCEDDHILPPVSVDLVQEFKHVFHVVNASGQLSFAPEVVYPNQEGFSAPRWRKRHEAKTALTESQEERGEARSNKTRRGAVDLLIRSQINF